MIRVFRNDWKDWLQKPNRAKHATFHQSSIVPLAYDPTTDVVLEASGDTSDKILQIQGFMASFMTDKGARELDRGINLKKVVDKLFVVDPKPDWGAMSMGEKVNLVLGLIWN